MEKAYGKDEPEYSMDLIKEVNLCKGYDRLFNK